MKTNLFKKIIMLFIDGALAIGVGVAVASNREAIPVNAADVVDKSVSFTQAKCTQTTSGYTGTAKYTDDISVSCANFNTNGSSWAYIKCGRKNTASVATIITDSAISTAISKVTVTIDSITANKVNSIKLYTSSNGSSWTEETSEFSKASGAQSVPLASATANLYYKVEFDMAGGSSNGLVQVSKIEYYKTVAADPTVTIADPVLAKLPAGYAASTTLTANATDFTGAVTYTWSISSGSSYVDISSNGADCTVTSKTTATAGSSATIQVSATDGNTTKTATKTITIETVHTVAETVSIISTGTASEKTGVFTKGFVNGYFKSGTGFTGDISESTNINNGKFSFFFSADGSEGTASTRIEAYNCKDVGNTDFTAKPALMTEVVLYGDVTLYSSTNEYADGCFLVYKAATTISGIAKTSDLTKSTYTVGETFSTAGLVITGTKSSGGTIDVTSKCTFSPANGEELTQELSLLTVTYFRTNTPSTSTGNDIIITIPITVTYPSADDTIDAIDAIGTVEYTQACWDLIDAARKSYDDLPSQSQENVTNYSDLEQAESDFDDLILENVANVESLIDAIGTVTLESNTAITAAENAYTALLSGNLGKSLVNADKYTALTTARTTYNTMVSDKEAADAVTALITALPAANIISDYSHHVDIVAARAAYNALTVAQKAYVSAETLQKLVDCETVDAQFEPLSVEMKFTGSSNYTTSDEEDAAATFNLNASNWSAICYKQSASAVAGNANDKEIRLYYNASGSNYIVVTAKDAAWTIDAITVTCTTNYDNFAIYAGTSIEGSEVSISGGKYTIDNSSFAIKNANSSNVQVRIKSILIEYSIEQASTADDFLDAVDAIPAVSNINASNLETVNGLITVAENEYAKLTAQLKEDSDVVAAKATLDAAKAKAIDVGYEVEAADTIAAIAALPEAASITDYSHHADIVAARTMYDALSAEAKAKVSNYAKLQACEAADAEHEPDAFDIDTDGGSEHSASNSTASTACNTAAALKTAYPVGTDLVEWKEGSTAYTASGKALKLGSSSSTGSVTLSFKHNRHYATMVTLDAYSWGGSATELSVNGVTHTLTGYSAAFQFDLTGVDFTGDVVIATTSTNDKRVTIYGINIAYTYRADYSAAKTFEEDYILNPSGNNIPYPDSTPTGVGGTGCLPTSEGGSGYFDAAVARYNSDSFGAAARLEFATHADFANARERFIAWGLANNGKVVTFDSNTGAIQYSARAFSPIGSVLENSATDIIIVTSLVSLTAIGGYFFIRKRKEQ